MSEHGVLCLSEAGVFGALGSRMAQDEVEEDARFRTLVFPRYVMESIDEF